MKTDHSDELAIIEAAQVVSLQRVEELRRSVDQARAEQPAKLAALRAQAELVRGETIAAEPWLDSVNAVPCADAETGELTGMMSMPSVDGKELWGTRLAFDLADAAGDQEAVDAVLNRYFTALHGNPEHLFLVFSAALATMAQHVLPVMLDKIEGRASDYAMRVTLADAARNAWATRISG